MDAAPRRRTALFVAVAVGSIVIGVAAVAGFGGLRTSTHAPTATVSGAAKDPVLGTQGSAPASPPIASVAPVHAEPAIVQERGFGGAAPIQVTVRGAPELAMIYLGEEKLGTAPGPVKVPRGTATLKLTIRADGFSPASVDVEPTENTVVSIKLTKNGTGKTGTGTKPPPAEIENPF